MSPVAARRLTAALALVAAAGWAGDVPPRPAALPLATVTRVVDGDTIDVVLPAGRRRVRLIGVDAPEVHEVPKLDRDVARSGRSRAALQALGRAATRFAERRLLGATVGLEFDLERHDRYGRLLAYVWLSDGTLFNAELLRAGQAQPMTIPPNLRYVGLFRRLAREARAAERGLWATMPARPPTRDRRRSARG